MIVDDYIKKVIEVGDEGSKFLAAKCAPTLKNSEFVDVLEEGMNGIAVLRIPKDYEVIVHSVGGDPKIKDLEAYASSLVDRLVLQSNIIGATPVAFANVVDSRTGDLSMLEKIANGLLQGANSHKLAIVNGENAILGDRVNCDANLSGTMISIRKLNSIFSLSPTPNINEEIFYAKFNPNGKAVFTNSDGIGTKTEFYERTERYELGLYDSLAMKVDDAIKIGATVMVVSDVVERKGNIPMALLSDETIKIMNKMGFSYILQEEDVGKRIKGYNNSVPSFNISGSCVSIIDEKRFKNPLKPSAKQYLIAIAGKPNPRSNGITDKRVITPKLFGEDYHTTREGKLFLEYLAQPSEVLYPLFKELVDNKLATSVYHMSGGAFNGKLARPIAKHDLYISIDNLFSPDWRELTLAGAAFTSAEKAYSKWPMGNDGFITTDNPDKAIRLIKKQGFDARVVGQLENSVNGKTGVELNAYNGEKVYFSGK